MKGRRVLAAIAIVALAGIGWRWYTVRRYRSAMAGIEETIRRGRYATAARELAAFPANGPGADRAAYLLGVCERASGRPRQAEAAWSAVPAGSPYIGRAIAGRMDLLVEQGRYADAERLVNGVAEGLGSEASASAVRLGLIPILVQEGRSDDARRLVEARWRALDPRDESTIEQAVKLARLHMELRWDPPPIGPLREAIERAGRLAPDDDRIWLARAHLAIRAGAPDEARGWLDRCRKARPDDPAVLRASEAPGCPKPDAEDPARAEAERRYRELYRRNQPARDADEMARLADRLGEPFEADLFRYVADADRR